MKLTASQINKAVNWWGDALKNPKFDTLGESRHADYPGNRPAQAAEMMATLSSQPPENGKINAFKAELGKTLEPLDLRLPQTILNSDYGPCRMLLEAAEKAGVLNGKQGGITTFPWKTTMWFHEDGSVKVSCGYGAEMKTL